MGHREDLLEGAKRCLLAKGFVRTTARDVVKESGTNLASIGYHYGSKDALLAQAYIALVEGMGDAFDGGGTVDGTEPGSLERFEQVWSNIIGTMKGPGSIWRLSMEVLAIGDQLPEVRDHLAVAQREAGRGLIPLLMGGREEDVADETADTLGMFYVTLMTGLIAQWTFDPKTAPGAEQLTAGLRRVVEAAAPR
ncbi:TetR/AcrR family transcriptional regulator [Streptomyces griseoloalbus]|uniref:AcrR family transcriptional regulator n=1 Tax=Streptomyces griseoloalbus TaxID=67303 RepID=A0A7W8F8R5_9ACTN|nr:TetR/AcrR family transcriptional regulator [Streptomyces albaduncus]MBB5127413.1 AcrR family transcriptional regulator [Streptomyces albaduncus]GGV74255.1 TetR family transcriptional regulator [Streptomyces griseoloalbus]GGW71401.1 TetR family transcriptional regulator [Streptomyces albaduncus]